MTVRANTHMTRVISILLSQRMLTPGGIVHGFGYPFITLGPLLRWVAGWRRGVVGLRGRAEQLGEDRLQRVGPDLIPGDRRMQLVARVHHAVEQAAVAVGQPVVDVQETNRA